MFLILCTTCHLHREVQGQRPASLRKCVPSFEEKKARNQNFKSGYSRVGVRAGKEEEKEVKEMEKDLDEEYEG